MDRNVRILFGSFALLVALSLLVWIIVAGGFDRPEGDGGWVYAYQTLIGVAGALAAAGFTVFMMHREQSQARKYFEKQMEVMTRPDRLLVLRETAHIIPRLQSSLESLRRLSQDLASLPDIGTILDPASWLKSVVAELRAALDTVHFSRILNLLDDRFIQLRDPLLSDADRTSRQIENAFADLSEDFGFSTPSKSNTLDFIKAEGWARFPDWERNLGKLICYFEALREDYRLPE